MCSYSLYIRAYCGPQNIDESVENLHFDDAVCLLPVSVCYN